MPWVRPTQATTVALLVSASLIKRTLCRSELARAYPRATQRRLAPPKHAWLHRVNRRWRFLNTERVDPPAVQLAVLPYSVAR